VAKQASRFTIKEGVIRGRQSPETFWDARPRDGPFLDNKSDFDIRSTPKDRAAADAILSLIQRRRNAFETNWHPKCRNWNAELERGRKTSKERASGGSFRDPHSAFEILRRMVAAARIARSSARLINCTAMQIL
jgi:hypothetical protein